MQKRKLDKSEKLSELEKYRDLVLATIDYYLDYKLMHVQTEEFDSVKHFQNLKTETKESFQKGQLTKLKQWFRDLTEMQVETVDLKFNAYLKEKTNYDFDIFDSFFQRVEKVIEKGKITTDNQFYDVNMMVGQLCQTEPVDNNKIDILNNLLREFETRKPKQLKKPTA